MKNLKNILTLFIVIFCFTNSGFADNIQYSLTAKNFANINSNTMEFDIYLKHNNPGSSVFKYTGGQFVFSFNPAFANGGTMSYSFADCNGGQCSDLPAVCRPGRAVVKLNQLFLTCNILQTGNNAPVVSADNDGTRIIRMRLHTTAASFSGSSGIKWNNFQRRGGTTHIAAYYNNRSNIITDSTGHFIGGSNLNANIKLAIQGFLNPQNNTLSMSDTVTAYLRNINSPYAFADSSKAVIDYISLTGNFNFANAGSGTYYIMLKHRNSIETWSKSGGEVFTTGNILNYDFTSAATQSYGSNMILIGSVYCIYNGDIDQDGYVDLPDASMIENDSYNFASGYLKTDINGDYVVDLSDMILVENNGYNFVSKVTPETTLNP